MSKTSLTDVNIELHVPDFKKAEEFYKKLGFEKVWEYPPKNQSGYMVMKRQDSIFAFYCGNEEVYNHPYFKKYSKDTPRGYGIEIVFYISEMPIDDYYKKIVERVGKDCVVEELKEQPWGIRDFRLVDPFGFYICVREADNILRP